LDPNKFLLEEMYLFFIAKNTLIFTLTVQRVFSCYIFASRCIWTAGLCWYSSKGLF
jgi:hypothetical protein